MVNEEPQKDVKQENNTILTFSLKRTPRQMAGERMEMSRLINIVWIDGLNSKIFEEEFILYLSVVISNISGSRR